MTPKHYLLIALVLAASNAGTYHFTTSASDATCDALFVSASATDIRKDLDLLLSIKRGEAERAESGRSSAAERLESWVDSNLIVLSYALDEPHLVDDNVLDALKRASIYRDKYPRASAVARLDGVPAEELAEGLRKADAAAMKSLEFGRLHGVLQQPWWGEQLE